MLLLLQIHKFLPYNVINIDMANIKECITKRMARTQI